MAEAIELPFTNHLGKVSKLAVDKPKEPIDQVAVKLVMEQIIAANVFGGTGGDLVAAAEARLFEHNVTNLK